MKVGPFMLGRGVTVIERNGSEISSSVALKEDLEPRRKVEVGASGGTSYGGMIDWDYNPDMRGQEAIKRYEMMRRSDGTVRAILRMMKSPLLSAQWYVAPASKSELDLEVSSFVWDALTSMSKTWIQYLYESLLMLDFGYYPFEKVFEYRKWRPNRPNANSRTVVAWKKWGPRHPRNTIGWDFDEHGGVKRLKQAIMKDSGYDEFSIDIEDMLLFTWDEEAGNPEGISVLRSAWKHYYYKDNLYKVDAIQKERHGIGIPICELPPNYTTEDADLAKEMTEHLRTNEKARVVLPPGFKLYFMKPEGQLVDIMTSVEHHDMQIVKNILAPFLNAGQGDSGSRAVATSQQDIFLKALRYVADLIRAVINKWAIPQLVKYNYDVDRMPELRVRRLGDTADFRAFAVALANLIKNGAITPDDELEEFVREIMDLPPYADKRSTDDRLAIPDSPGRDRETVPENS